MGVVIVYSSMKMIEPISRDWSRHFSRLDEKRNSQRLRSNMDEKRDLETGCPDWRGEGEYDEDCHSVEEEKNECTKGPHHERESNAARPPARLRRFESPIFQTDDDNDDCDDDEEGEDNDGCDGQINETVEEHSPTPPPLQHRPALQRQNRFRQNSNIVRRKSKVDIETGKSHEHLIHCEIVEDELFFQPMNPAERRWKQFLRPKKASQPRTYRQSLIEPVFQYRLTSRKRSRGWWKSLKKAITSEDFSTNQGLSSWIADYLNWTHQTNFVIVFLASSSFFIFFALIFGIAFYVAGRHQPDCINVGSLNFDSSGHYFMDAFSLSWQTVTTAGYGVIYPGVSTQSRQYCIGLNMLTALESFCGVLLASCITAIIFSKVIRVQAVAAVEFCDPLLVRYGVGVLPPEDDEIFSEISSTDATAAATAAATASAQSTRSKRQKTNSHLENMLSRRSRSQIPCPILEFRLMNRLNDHSGGEVCNASVNVVAVTIAASGSSLQATNGIGNGHGTVHQRKHKKSITKTIQTGGAMLRDSAYRAGAVTGAVLTKSGDAILKKSGAAAVVQKSASMFQKLNQSLAAVPEARSIKDTPEESQNDNRRPRSPYGASIPVSVIEASRRHLAVDEEPNSLLVPRRIFSKLDIETDVHPFFRRVWHVRHVLNEHSPLLSGVAKRLIEEHQGFWPEELNSYEKVRKHIRFHEIIVNFSGTSNVSGATVYSQKVYSFAAMNVGYRFANMLLKDEDGKLVVDAGLLNDVLEQLGGGGEPLAITSRNDAGSWDVAVEAAKVTAEMAMSSADAVARVAMDVAQTTANTVARTTTNTAAAVTNNL